MKYGQHDGQNHPAEYAGRMPLEAFTPQVREWFGRAFEAPTPAQAQAWPAIATGAHTLISAPTGSGKTLAAFLWALDHLHRLGLELRAEPATTFWLNPSLSRSRGPVQDHCCIPTLVAERIAE